MHETTKEFHILLCSAASAEKLISTLPDHSIEGEHHELLLRSYTILVHAAIEEYLENVSLSTLNYCIAAFHRDFQIRAPLFSAINYYRFGWALDAPSGFFNPDNLEENPLILQIISKISEKHKNAVQSVNGIKTADQEKLLNPIGVSLFDFDRFLSGSLNSLGEVRGKFAHTFRMKTVTPKAGVIIDSNSLIRLLQSLDNLLCVRENLLPIYSNRQ